MVRGELFIRRHKAKAPCKYDSSMRYSNSHWLSALLVQVSSNI